jgi:hypothetical protein
MKCKLEKSKEDFYKHKSHSDGLYDYCKPCWTSYQYSPEQKLKTNKRNIERGHQSQKKYEWLRNYNLKKKYGITLNQYNQKLIEQSGNCALCEKNHRDCKNGLVVDHDHSSGKVRDLLCVSCNLLIGNSREKSELLIKAVSYLDKHKDKKLKLVNQ